jgi:hypothetical protein
LVQERNYVYESMRHSERPPLDEADPHGSNFECATCNRQRSTGIMQYAQTALCQSLRKTRAEPMQPCNIRARAHNMQRDQQSPATPKRMARFAKQTAVSVRRICCGSLPITVCMFGGFTSAECMFHVAALMPPIRCCACGCDSNRLHRIDLALGAHAAQCIRRDDASCASTCFSVAHGVRFGSMEHVIKHTDISRLRQVLLRSGCAGLVEMFNLFLVSHTVVPLAEVQYCAVWLEPFGPALLSSGKHGHCRVRLRDHLQVLNLSRSNQNAGAYSANGPQNALCCDSCYLRLAMHVSTCSNHAFLLSAVSGCWGLSVRCCRARPAVDVAAHRKE